MTREEELAEMSEIKQCLCGKQIPRDEDYCPYCGNDNSIYDEV